ncbi:MAG: hypothetical protein ACP5N3_01675 [Candidatus Nanoarchaeia archaeon]
MNKKGQLLEKNLLFYGGMITGSVILASILSFIFNVILYTKIIFFEGIPSNSILYFMFCLGIVFLALVTLMKNRYKSWGAEEAKLILNEKKEKYVNSIIWTAFLSLLFITIVLFFSEYVGIYVLKIISLVFVALHVLGDLIIIISVEKKKEKARLALKEYLEPENPDTKEDNKKEEGLARKIVELDGDYQEMVILPKSKSSGHKSQAPKKTVSRKKQTLKQKPRKKSTKK